MSFPNLPLILTFDEELMQKSPFEVIVPNSVSLTVSTKTQEIDVEVKEWTTPGQAGVLFQQIIKCEMIKIQTLPKSRPQ